MKREHAEAVRRELAARLLLVMVAIGIGAEAGLLIGWWLTR